MKSGFYFICFGLKSFVSEIVIEMAMSGMRIPGVLTDSWIGCDFSRVSGS